MTAQILHCIFDLDGTLFNSKQQIINSVVWTREKYGLEPLDSAGIQALIGLPAKHLFADQDCDARLLEELVLVFRNRLREEIALRNEAFPGVFEFLSHLKSNGARLSVATTKPSALAKWTIDHSNLSILIDHIQGTDNFAPKPSPEVILKCVSRSEMKQVYMFGDRTEDMTAAKSAGVIGVGIAQSVHTESDLKKSGADFTFSSFSLYPEIIRVLFKSNETN